MKTFDGKVLYKRKGVVFGLGLALSSYFVFCCWSQASGSVSGVGLGLDAGLGWLWEVGEREKT